MGANSEIVRMSRETVVPPPRGTATAAQQLPEPALQPCVGAEPKLTSIPEAHFTLQSGAASTDQVNHQDDQRNYQQNVNQATGDVEAKAQKPQNQQNDKNCPKHIQPPLSNADA
jgi:hypothetical protein